MSKELVIQPVQTRLPTIVLFELSLIGLKNESKLLPLQPVPSSRNTLNSHDPKDGYKYIHAFLPPRSLQTKQKLYTSWNY